MFWPPWHNQDTHGFQETNGMLPIALLSTLVTLAALRHASHGWHPMVHLLGPPAGRQCCKNRVEGNHIWPSKSSGFKNWSLTKTARVVLLATVDGRNPAITSWYGKYPIIYRVLSPSQVVGPWDFFHHSVCATQVWFIAQFVSRFQRREIQPKRSPFSPVGFCWGKNEPCVFF